MRAKKKPGFFANFPKDGNMFPVIVAVAAGLYPLRVGQQRKPAHDAPHNVSNFSGGRRAVMEVSWRRGETYYGAVAARHRRRRAGPPPSC